MVLSGQTVCKKGESVKLSKEEIRRKLLHLFALLMPVGIFYGPEWSFPPLFVPILLGTLFFASVIVEFLRFKSPAVQAFFFKCFGSMLRKEEHFKVTGSTWVIGAGFICSILFAHEPYISFIALFLFILGDAMAALVGISMGRVKIGKKSLEGSMACFLTCVALFYLVFPLFPGLLDVWNNRLPHSIVLVTALVITVFELVPLKVHPRVIINDNLAVPVIAGYVIKGLGLLLFS
jgi:dolichol kinase